jgi:hypothetical protein
MPNPIPIKPRREVRKPQPPPNPRTFYHLATRNRLVMDTMMTDATHQGCEVYPPPVYELDTKEYVVWISKPSTK